MFSCEYATTPARLVSTNHGKGRGSSAVRKVGRRSGVARSLAPPTAKLPRALLTRRLGCFRAAAAVASRRLDPTKVRARTRTVCTCFGLGACVYSDDLPRGVSRVAPRRVDSQQRRRSLLPFPSSRTLGGGGRPFDVRDSSARRTACVLCTALEVIAPVFSCLPEDRVTCAYDSRARKRETAASVCARKDTSDTAEKLGFSSLRRRLRSRLGAVGRRSK